MRRHQRYGWERGYRLASGVFSLAIRGRRAGHPPAASRFRIARETGVRFRHGCRGQTAGYPTRTRAAATVVFRSGPTSRGILAVAVFLLLGAAGAASAWSAEPAREFLKALRERGYHDVAVRYLERMRENRLAPVELKETMLYEMGATLIEASRQQRDMGLRQQQLEQARAALQQFVGQQSDHPLRSSAESQLGNLLVERARIGVEQSKQSAANKETLLAEARQRYDDAYKVFARSQSDLREKLETMKVIPESDKARLELRDRLREDYLQAQLLAAAVKEESAETHARGSAEHTQLLTEAAGQYGEIHEKYRTRLAGLYARMYQGRCLQDMGKTKDALSYYEELLEQPDEPDAFRVLKTKTLKLALEGWMASKPPLAAEAVKRLEPRLADVRPVESRTPEWLALRLGLAQAQKTQAEQLKKGKANDPQAKRLLSEARKNAQFVSKVTGDLQQDARQLLAQLGGGEELAGEAEPKTFAEARQAGRDALDSLQTAGLVLSTVPARLAKEQDPAVKKQLQEQVEQAKAVVATAEEDALRYFQLALEMAGKDTDLRDLNVVRYFLGYLHYTAGRYRDAAVLSQFVARRYPDSAGARQCAKIAMASFVKLYADDASPEKAFASRHLVEIANFVAEKWPDQPEAIDALNTLIPFMIKAEDLDKAEAYLERIPEGSVQRGDAENKTGQAMWSAYLQGMQELGRWERGDDEPPAGFDKQARQVALDQLKARAQRILEAGAERMRGSGKVDENGVAAALSLAQLYVDTGQADKAVGLLEDQQTGPYALVESKSPSTQREGFANETYKTTLRAYISSLATARDPQAVVASAEKVMDAMKGAVDQEQLISIYISLARDLEAQLKLASPESKAALSKGFETFLDRLASTSSDLSVLNWVAETFNSLAAGFETGPQLTPEARQYYSKAAGAYEKLLADKSYGDDDKRKTTFQLRLATMKSKLGEFPAARDIFKNILAVSRTMLNVQVEAAQLYQQWGAAPGQAANYEQAMGGAEPDEKGKNIIWGWGQLAQVTARYPQYRDVFHQSRYNLALCRFQMSQAASAKDVREQQLDKAQRAILDTQKLYGIGSEWEAWKPKYDALLKRIQKARGESPVGLPGNSTVANAKA